MLFEAVNERIFCKRTYICTLRLKGRFLILSVHALMEVKDDELKDKFELMVESTYAALPRYDVKTVKGDLYTNIGKEKFFRSTIGKEIKHDQMTNGLIIALINCNGKRNWDERKNTTGVDFATVKKEDMPNSEICKSIALFSTAFTEVLKVIKFKNNSLSGKRNG